MNDAAVAWIGQRGPTGHVVAEVFGHVPVQQRAARLAGLIDPGFLVECGWDVAGQIVAPPSEHPRLGWPKPVGDLSPVGACAVGGCSRRARSHGLCRSDRGGQLRRGMSVADYASAPTRRALAPLGVCQPTACPRERQVGQVTYRQAHQGRWLRERGVEPGLDESRWPQITSPVVVTGQISLAGMPPLIIAEVLYGPGQRTRSGAHTRIQVLRGCGGGPAPVASRHGGRRSRPAGKRDG